MASKSEEVEITSTFNAHYAPEEFTYTDDDDGGPKLPAGWYVIGGEDDTSDIAIHIVWANDVHGRPVEERVAKAIKKALRKAF